MQNMFWIYALMFDTDTKFPDNSLEYPFILFMSS